MYAFQGGIWHGMLALINQERALVGVPPLTWSNSLADGAQTYAEIWRRQASSNTRPRVGSRPPNATRLRGENLAGAETRRLQPIAQMQAADWISEKNDYHGQLTGSETPGRDYRSLHTDGMEYNDPGWLRDRQWRTAWTGRSGIAATARRATSLGRNHIKRASFLLR